MQDLFKYVLGGEGFQSIDEFQNSMMEPNQMMEESTQEVEQTQPMIEQPVQTTEETTEPPPAPKSLRVGDPVKESTTTETEDKSDPIYDINNNYIVYLNDKTIELDVKKASKLFTALDQNPVVDGKPVDAATLPELMKDPNKRKIIMDQVAKLESDPNLSIDDKWEIYTNNKDANALNQAIPLIQKKMDEMMFKSAQVLDSKYKAKGKEPKGTDLKVDKERANWRWAGVSDDKHDVKAVDLFNDKGGFRDKQDFTLLFLQRKVDAYNQFIAEENKKFAGSSSIVAASNRPAYVDENGNRVAFNVNQLNEARYKDAATQLQNIDPNDPTGRKRLLRIAELKQKLNERDKENIKNYGTDKKIDPNRQAMYDLAQAEYDKLTKPAPPSAEGAYLNRFGGRVSFEALPKVTSKNYKQVVSMLQSNLRKLGKDSWANDASIKRAEDVYNTMKTDIINEYNQSDNAAIYKIQAELEGKFINNKGGETQSSGAIMDFDFANPFKDVKKKKTGGKKDEINETNVVFNYVLYDKGQASYKIGPVKNDETGDFLVPERSEDLAKDIKGFVQQMQDDIKTALPDLAKDRKPSVKLPQGKLTLTRKCFDEDGNEFYAFHLSFNKNYLNQKKFTGSTKDKEDAELADDTEAEGNEILIKYPQLKEEGLTIFVPADVPKKGRVVREIEKVQGISPTEALLALDVPTIPAVDVPGGGRIELTQNKENNTVTLQAFEVGYNYDNNRYDTMRIEPMTFRKDQFTDIDKAIDDALYSIKGVFYENEYLKKEAEARKGVKNPDQLRK